VLYVLADTLEKNRRRPRTDKGETKFLNFVRAGEKSCSRGVEGSGLFDIASD
jgi:hypothetical protein